MPSACLSSPQWVSKQRSHYDRDARRGLNAYTTKTTITFTSSGRRAHPANLLLFHRCRRPNGSPPGKRRSPQLLPLNLWPLLRLFKQGCFDSSRYPPSQSSRSAQRPTPPPPRGHAAPDGHGPRAKIFPAPQLQKSIPLLTCAAFRNFSNSTMATSVFANRRLRANSRWRRQPLCTHKACHAEITLPSAFMLLSQAKLIAANFRSIKKCSNQNAAANT